MKNKVYFDRSLKNNEKAIIFNIVEKIKDSSPGDSNFRWSLQRVNSFFKVFCRINSQCGEFVAEALAKDPIQAAQKIEKSLSKQLSQWMNTRFDKLKYS